MNAVRVALAGLGDIGMTAHLPALLRNPSVRVAALVDPDPARIHAAAPMVAGARTAPDLGAVLDDTEIDAVVLATPPWVTTGLIAEVTGTGRFVLAEKPVATSGDAAAPLRALAADQAELVQVGLTYRHDPALALLRTWLADGVLGHRVLVRAHIYDEPRRAADPGHTNRMETTLASGMPVIHEGAHVFDWLGHLFGRLPDTLHDAWSLSTRDDLPGPNLCGARLSYQDGTVVLAEFGWLTDALPRSEIDVIGDRGRAVLDGATFRLELSTADGQVERVAFEPDRATRCFDRQLERFVELCTGASAAPSPDLADGLAALDIGERVARLAGEGHVVIDFHTHTPALRTGTWLAGAAFGATEFVDFLDVAGIEAAVVLAHDGLFNATPQANDDLAAFVGHRPDRMIGFGTVNPRHSDAVAETRRCVTELGLRGLKLHPWLQGFSVHEASLDPICEVVTEADGIVLCHDGTPPYSTPAQIAALARRHPRLPVVLGHGGLHDCWREALAATIETANLYLCLCGTPPYAARHILAHAPAGKVLFGTDAGLSSKPGQDYAVARVREIDGWGISASQRAAMVTGNPMALLGRWLP